MKKIILFLIFVSQTASQMSFADDQPPQPVTCPVLAGKYFAKQCRTLDSQNAYTLVEIVQPNCFVIGTRALTYSKDGVLTAIGNTTWLATQTGLYIENETNALINTSERVYNENSLIEYNYVTNKSNNQTVLNVVNYLSLIKDGNLNTNFFKLNNMGGVYINEKNCKSEL